MSSSSSTKDGTGTSSASDVEKSHDGNSTDKENGGLTLSFDTAVINQRGFEKDDSTGELDWDMLVRYRKDLSVSNDALLDSMGANKLKPSYRY